jgi:hypothetical protein
VNYSASFTAKSGEQTIWPTSTIATFTSVGGFARYTPTICVNCFCYWLVSEVVFRIHHPEASQVQIRSAQVAGGSFFNNQLLPWCNSLAAIAQIYSITFKPN